MNTLLNTIIVFTLIVCISGATTIVVLLFNEICNVDKGVDK
jgi:hypothetical protein